MLDQQDRPFSEYRHRDKQNEPILRCFKTIEQGIFQPDIEIRR